MYTPKGNKVYYHGSVKAECSSEYMAKKMAKAMNEQALRESRMKLREEKKPEPMTQPLKLVASR